MGGSVEESQIQFRLIKDITFFGGEGEGVYPRSEIYFLGFHYLVNVGAYLVVWILSYICFVIICMFLFQRRVDPEIFNISDVSKSRDSCYSDWILIQQGLVWQAPDHMLSILSHFNLRINLWQLYYQPKYQMKKLKGDRHAPGHLAGERRSWTTCKFRPHPTLQIIFRQFRQDFHYVP